MIDNRTQVFDVAMKNARTIEACLDRLAMMGADRELKMIAGRLSRLTFRAAPGAVGASCLPPGSVSGDTQTFKKSPGRAGALGSIEEHI
jgi:hypothetical protein